MEDAPGFHFHQVASLTVACERDSSRKTDLAPALLPPPWDPKKQRVPFLESGGFLYSAVGVEEGIGTLSDSPTTFLEEENSLLAIARRHDHGFGRELLDLFP